MLRHIFIGLFALFLAFSTNAQNDNDDTQDDFVLPEDTIPNPNVEFGFDIGLMWTNFDLEPDYNYIEADPTFNSVYQGNNGGMTAGIHVMIKTKERQYIRPALNFTLDLATINYDRGEIGYEENSVYPFSVELPLSYVYHFSENKNWNPSIIGGFKGIMAVAINQVERPQVDQGDVQAELGFGLVKSNGRTMTHMDLIFSWGFRNIISNVDNPYNRALKTAHRNMVSLRFHFN